jgi:hypothetical protein
MPAAILSKADALQVLDRYIYCLGRADAADKRAWNAGGSVTGDRHRSTAINWQDKADEALDALRLFLEGER